MSEYDRKMRGLEPKRLPYLDREPRPWSWATTLVLLTVCSCAFGFVLGLFIAGLLIGGLY